MQFIPEAKMKVIDYIKLSANESIDIKKSIVDQCSVDIEKAIEIIIKCFINGNKLLLCGNGGSAADCQHVAAEMMIRLAHNIKRPALPAIALTTDTSILTAGGNDIGFDNVFARLVEGLGKENDILFVISTSGNSRNIINAVLQAKKNNVKIIGLLGKNGGELKQMVDISIIIPSDNIQRIQEGHLFVEHIICELVEIKMFS